MFWFTLRQSELFELRDSDVRIDDIEKTAQIDIRESKTDQQ